MRARRGRGAELPAFGQRVAGGTSGGRELAAATAARGRDGTGARAVAVRACSGVEPGGGGAGWSRLADRGGPGPVRHHLKVGLRSLDRENGDSAWLLVALGGRSGSGHICGRSRPPWVACQ